MFSIIELKDNGENMRLIGSKPYKVTSVAQDVIAGTEIFDNPGFDSDVNWTKEGGWTITGGEAVATSAGSTSTIHQDTNSPSVSMNDTMQLGKTYVLKFTISDYEMDNGIHVHEAINKIKKSKYNKYFYHE